MDSVKTAAFLAVVDEGSITAAAGRLGYTPSGVSRMVEALEGELGFPLFSRSHAGMALTPDGERMLPVLRQLGRWESRVDQEAGQIRGVVTGQVSVASYFSVAAEWLPSVLREFGSRYPQVRVNATEGGNAELLDWLGSSRVDCGIMNRRGFSGDFIHLHYDQMVVWLPAGHELARLDAIPVASLEGLPFIMPLPGTRNDVETYLERAGVHVDLRFSARGAESLWAMVEAGLGVSMNNALMSGHLSGGVVERPLDPPYRIDLGIAVPSLADASPATRRFVEVAREVVGGLTAGEKGAGK